MASVTLIGDQPRRRSRPLPRQAFTDAATYRATRQPVQLASTLIPDAYTSHDFFEIEQERVFTTSWVAVGTTDQLARPGQVIVTDVGGRSVVVTRDEGGDLRGFHNVCRHRGTKLLDAECTAIPNGKIRCPYHSWTYDLEGRCIGTPLFDGADIPDEAQGAFDTSGSMGFDRTDYGLHQVRVVAWGFLVFINLDPATTTLAEQLGDLPDRLSGYRLDQWRVVRRRCYEVAANYKLIGENFMECYHLPWVHPELNKVSRLQDHYRWQGPGMYTGMCTTPISRNTDDGGWEGLPPRPGLGGLDADAGRFVWLFPNTAISVLPNHAFVLLTRPLGPDRTVEEAVILTHPDCLQGVDAEDEIGQLERFWDLVNAQDLAIVERVQRGIANPAYEGGRMCYRFEEPLHRFQNMIVDRMLGITRVPAGDANEMTPMFPTG